MNNLANTLEKGRKATPDAEAVERRAVELDLRVFGPQHPSTLLSMISLATILLDQDHYSDAEKIYRQILGVQRDVFGPENPETLHTMELLGVTLAYEKHYPEAEGLFREVNPKGCRPGTAWGKPELSPVRGITMRVLRPSLVIMTKLSTICAKPSTADTDTPKR